MNWFNADNRLLWGALFYVIACAISIGFGVSEFWLYLLSITGTLAAVYVIFFDMLKSVRSGYFAYRVLMRISTSAILFVVAATLFFLAYGLHHSVPANKGPEALDSLYFSIVSFSTLGYGDITTSGIGRLASSMLAVIGNLHLALIAGASFTWITASKI